MRAWRTTRGIVRIQIDFGGAANFHHVRVFLSASNRLSHIPKIAIGVEAAARVEGNGERLARLPFYTLAQIPNHARHKVEKLRYALTKTTVEKHGICFRAIELGKLDGTIASGEVRQRDTRKGAFGQRLPNARGNPAARHTNFAVGLHRHKELLEIAEEFANFLEAKFLANDTFKLVHLRRVHLNACEIVRFFVPGDFALVEKDVIVRERHYSENREINYHATPPFHSVYLRL